MYKKLMAVMVIGVTALVLVVSQQIGRTAPALTALDYAEIQQLYTRYAFGFDTGADDEGMWARVFTEDGVMDVTNPTRADFTQLQGHEQLKAYATRHWSTGGTRFNTPLHYTTNILIEPTAEGAMGAAYVITVGNAEDGIRAKGVYHDQLVKTPEGWRFKKRTFTNGGFPDELLHALEQ